MCPLCLSLISLSNLITRQRFLALLTVDSIIVLLCTYPQTVGGRDVKGTCGLIRQPFHPGALCCIWLDCLNVSWYQGTQTCRPGREDKEWRGNGDHSSPRVTGIVLEQAPVTPEQWPQRLGREREREIGDRVRRETGHQTVKKSLSYSFPPSP